MPRRTHQRKYELCPKSSRACRLTLPFPPPSSRKHLPLPQVHQLRPDRVAVQIQGRLGDEGVVENLKLGRVAQGVCRFRRYSLVKADKQLLVLVRQLGDRLRHGLRDREGPPAKVLRAVSGRLATSTLAQNRVFWAFCAVSGRCGVATQCENALTNWASLAVARLTTGG